MGFAKFHPKVSNNLGIIPSPHYQLFAKNCVFEKNVYKMREILGV